MNSMFEEKDVITLDNGNKYIIAKVLNFNNKNYLYMVGYEKQNDFKYFEINSEDESLTIVNDNDTLAILCSMIYADFENEQ